MRVAACLPFFALAACLGPAPDPPPIGAASACAETVFPTDPSVTAATVGRFTGSYVAGRENILVSLSGNRLLAHRVGYGMREIRADPPGGATFRDACGTTYAFMVPASGRGASVTVTDPGVAPLRYARRGY